MLDRQGAVIIEKDQPTGLDRTLPMMDLSSDPDLLCVGFSQVVAVGPHSPVDVAELLVEVHTVPFGDVETLPVVELTLARLRDASPADLARHIAHSGQFMAMSFVVDRFVLLSSRESVGGGPYIVEERFELTGKRERLRDTAPLLRHAR